MLKLLFNLNNVADAQVTKRLLFEKGYEIAEFCCMPNTITDNFYQYIKQDASTIIILGDNLLVEFLKTKFFTDIPESIFTLDEISYAVMPEFNPAFVLDSIIPLLNSNAKTFYTTVRLKTFGLTLQQVRENLSAYIKNRNKVVFSFYDLDGGIEVNIRYSSKTTKQIIDEILIGSTTALADNLYSIDNRSLLDTVCELLKIRKVKISLAESFTSGALAAMLTKTEGASAYFLESAVCYSDDSKSARLGIAPQTIIQHTAVSEQVAYEMAVGLFNNPECNVAIATTGYASDNIQKPEKVGECFIALGTREGIHIYKNIFSGNRAQITNQAINFALFKLYKLLK